MKNPNVINIDLATDIATAKLRANYGNPATGYLEPQADELRAKILNSPNTEEIYEIKGTKYYVSANGNDENDGLSPEKAICSIDAIEKLPLKEGDAVLFERGSIFRFGRTLNTTNGVTYGSYGEGMKPKIFGSPENYAENDSWVEVKPNIWQIAFDYPYASGCILDYGMVAGIQKWKGIDTMEANGDYYHDLENKVFHLYCDQGKPSEVYHDIEIMPTIYLFFMRGAENNIIDNICFKYTSAFAIFAPDAKSNITVTNCEIGYIGGLWVSGKIGWLRYGNSIEFWAGIPGLVIENILVKNNWFYQVYDSALTWQGDQKGTVYKDITYTENLFEYNNADIEFFDQDTSVLDNFVMSNNLMRFTSMGWGTRTNDGGIRGIEGCIRGVTGGYRKKDDNWVKSEMDVKSAYFTDNTMDSPARQIINWNVIPHQKENIHASGSTIYVKSEYRTLVPCLQGLQDDMYDEHYDIRFADNKQELEEMLQKFEKGAKIYWDGE